MIRLRRTLLGLAFGLSAVAGARATLAQDPPAPPLDEPQIPGIDKVAEPDPAPAAEAPQVARRGNLPAVFPLVEGPLHEAFLSPVRDAEPKYTDRAPPSPISERPGIDRPSADAQWIEGYWGWDANKNDYVWVTGTWRIPPPGKFWVNGYWKREEKGWYRVSGFWSDRQTDRIDWRKNGPPVDRPADNPGPAPIVRPLLHPRPILPRW